MKQKKIVLALSAVLISGNLFAAFNGLSWHSRANCLGINESISWDWTKNHLLRTVSTHWFCDLRKTYCDKKHVDDTGFENTWRNAVVHWTEARGYPTRYEFWSVNAEHFIKEGRNIRKLGETRVNNCSIYNGWWDRNK